MGTAYYCDRCGKLYNDEKVKRYFIEVKGMDYLEDLTYDLCQECRDEVEGFFMGDDLKK